MSEPVRLWLDDERPMPPGFTLHCRTAEQAIEAIKSGNVVEVSLDYFLGVGCPFGIEVAVFIERGARDGTIPRMRLRAHTGNANAKQVMHEYFRAASKAWMARESTVVENL